MPANLTIYLLEELTDYTAFERLCHDLMALEGYNSIEPLGGSGDKGRDALHVDRSNGAATIFAYSVREDWQAKLAEDANKVRKHNHKCDRLVFITTSKFTVSERDKAVARLLSDFGLQLDLYGSERLRVLLDSSHPQVKKNHPQIFPPEFLRLDRANNGADSKHLFIAFVREDRLLAEWITRKLTAEGYSVWCESFKLLGGERYPNDINKAIKENSFRLIALYSSESLTNAEFIRQTSFAFNLGEERSTDFVIPLRLQNLDLNKLDKASAPLVFVPFERSWAKGIEQLLSKLDAIGCPKTLAYGKLAAKELFAENDVISSDPEEILTNCFKIKQIPKAIYKFSLKKEFFDQADNTFSWAFRRIGPTEVLSFHHPSYQLVKDYEINETGGYSWEDYEEITWNSTGGIRKLLSPDLVSELIRKSLLAKCREKGLVFSADTTLHYFRDGAVQRNRLKVTLPGGKESHVLTCGKRKYYRPNNMSEYYNYFLAPTFKVRSDLFENFAVILQLRVHLTNGDGDVLEPRKRNSRRKHLCKNWWNDDWLKRNLAIAQFLADGDQIIIGDIPKEQLIMQAQPVSFVISGGINESRLGKGAYERDSTLLEDGDTETEGD